MTRSALLYRSIAILVALSCGASTPALAAPAGSPASEAEAAYKQAQVLAEEEKYLAAAKELERALAAVPVNAVNRARRNQIVSEAITAYRLAFEQNPADCSALLDGLALASRFLEEVQKTYGEAATAADDHGAVSELRKELVATTASKCPTPTTTEGSDPPLPTPSAAEPKPEPEPPIDEPKRRGSRVLPFAVGVGVSAGLTVGMAIGSAVLFTQLRKPDGSRYAPIREASAEAGLPTDSDSDMCARRGESADVAAACDRWTAGYRGLVATSVLTGVFVVSTAVLTGLLIRERRAASPAAQAWRRHQVTLGAAPRFGGATLTAGFRF